MKFYQTVPQSVQFSFHALITHRDVQFAVIFCNNLVEGVSLVTKLFVNLYRIVQDKVQLSSYAFITHCDVKFAI